MIYLALTTPVLIISGLMPYYAASVLKPPFSVAWYPFTLSAVGMSSIPIWVKLMQNGLEKTAVLQICYLIFSLCCIGAAFLDEGHGWIFLLIIVIFGVVYGGAIFVPSAMMPDIQDYGELLNGLRQEGKYLGFWKIASRVVAGFALGIVFTLLDVSGYEEGTDCQNEGVLFALKLLVGVPTTLCFLIGIVYCRRYPMNGARHEEVLSLIVKRHEGFQEEVQCPVFKTLLPPWPASQGSSL